MRYFPDPVLRKKAKKVQRFGPSLRRIIHTLEKAMKQQPSGIGIAAPQMGLSWRVAIVDVSARVPAAKRLYLINPVILEHKNEKASREGCMSVPDYTGNLKRYDWIRVRWQDEEGSRHEGVFQGIEAVCIQHEIDHLEGTLFLDRVVSMKRDMIPRLKKYQ